MNCKRATAIKNKIGCKDCTFHNKDTDKCDLEYENGGIDTEWDVER